jgi:hypothetical protein
MFNFRVAVAGRQKLKLGHSASELSRDRLKPPVRPPLFQAASEFRLARDIRDAS